MSLKQCFADISLISKISVFDDHSPESDVRQMHIDLKTLFPGREIQMHTSERVIGHPKIMQKWFSLLSGEFVFHCEDDWEFIRNGSPLCACLDVMSFDSNIGQVCFSKVYNKGQEQTPSGVRYRKLIGDIQKAASQKNYLLWPKFTLNPSLIRVEAIKNVGNFEDRKDFEYHYGMRWSAARVETAFLADQFVRHLGQGRSAYLINGTAR